MKKAEGGGEAEERLPIELKCSQKPFETIFRVLM